MSDAPTNPNPATPSGPPAIPTTAELIAAVEAERAAKPAAAPPAAPPGDAASASTSATSTEPSPSSTPEPEKKPDAGTEDELRLIRLAKEQRRLDAQKRELSDREKRLTGAAEDGQKWRTLQETMSKSGRLAAAQALYGESLEDFYWELNDHILKLAEKGKTKTPQQVAEEAAARKAEQVLADREKAAEDKRAADEKAAQERVTANQTQFVANVSAYHAANYDKFPALKALLADFPGAVTDRDILTFVTAEHAKTGTLPDHPAILQHFEGKAKAKMGTAVAANPATKTVTTGMKSDVPVTTDRKLTLAEIHEQAKREAGIIT